MENNNNRASSGNGEIDVMEIVRKLWDHRMLILKIAACFLAVGLFVAVFSPKEYSVSRVFVPQSTNNKISSRYSSLASMMGMDFDLQGSDSQLSPKVYPHILNNVDFLTDLMHTGIHFNGYDKPVELYDYFTDPQYHKFNLISFVKKYTVGLPGLIIGAIAGGKDKEEAVAASDSLSDGGMKTRRLTAKEANVARRLKSLIKMDVNPKEGYLTLSVRMSEPVACAELCDASFLLLKKYIANFKTEKSKANLEFIEDRCAEAKADYEKKQSRYAYFVDSHRGLSTAMSNVEGERLYADMELSRQLYSEMSKSLMSAQVKVKEDAVSLADLTPVSVPDKKTKPKRLQILFVWAFLGIVAGCGYVWGRDWWSGFHKNWKSAEN